jgi:hypothetical protein
MHFLAEDPWPLIGVLGVVAAGCLIALKLTQQGKYLIWALGCLALAGLMFGIERIWVTDAERIEDVVRSLGRDAARSDIEGVFSRLTPDATFSSGAASVKGPFARGLIKKALEETRFDFVRISQVHADVRPLARRGTAEFRVHTGGSHGHYNFLTGPEGTDWSFGFEETGDHQWKVNRISATRLPQNFRNPVAQLLGAAN